MEVTESLKLQVWKKGIPIKGYNTDMWRRDIQRKALKFTDYGNRDSTYGWEIDHIKLIRYGGKDDLDNLRPLHWKHNAQRQN